MSLLYDPSIKRIKEGKIGGDGMVTLFENLAIEAEQNEVPVMILIVPYIDDSDKPENGEYIPELHLIVRKAND
jgi:hypothetical protein